MHGHPISTGSGEFHFPGRQSRFNAERTAFPETAFRKLLSVSLQMNSFPETAMRQGPWLSAFREPGFWHKSAFYFTERQTEIHPTLSRNAFSFLSSQRSAGYFPPVCR